MVRLQLSEQEIVDINEALDDPNVSDLARRKLLVVRMNDEEFPHFKIARLFNISEDSVSRYVREYEQSGLSGVLEDRYYKPTSSVEAFLSCLKCRFTLQPVHTAKEGMEVIEQVSGVKLSEEQVRRIMKRLGMKFIKTAPRPGKADPTKQLEFFNEQLEPRLQEAAAGERKVFFVDAAHFVMGAFLGMIWCFERVFIKTPSGRKRYNVLAALDSQSKELMKVTNESYINSSTVCELIAAIRALHSEVPITLVLDNARYQHCQLVVDYAKLMKIELLFLPSYSPNLNLIERLWRLVKAKALKNKYYSNFKRFKAGVDEVLESLDTKYREDLESLLVLKFQFFSRLECR
jgi:transposase